MAFPLLALAGRKIGSETIKKALPLAKRIINPKQTNIDFLTDRGKPDFQNFQFDSKGFKKHFNKIEDNPKEILESFKEEIPGTNEVANSINGVDFEIPEIEMEMENGTASPGQELIKTPSPFFGGVGNLGSLIQGGRTFGSISLLLFVILFIVFAIRPVGNSNETRLTLSFKTLLGMTELEGLATEEEIDENAKNGADVDSSTFLDAVPGFARPVLGVPAVILDNSYDFVNSPTYKGISTVYAPIRNAETFIRGIESVVGKISELFRGNNK